MEVSDWFMSLRVTDYIDFFMLLSVIIGGIFALIQWTKANRNRRAEFVLNLIEKLYNDQDIASTIYLFEYDREWYKGKFHNDMNKKLEPKVDKTLYYLSYICYLRCNNLISKKDFNFFDYIIKRMAQNPSDQEYLSFLQNLSERNKAKMPFFYLFNYCHKKKYL